MCHFAKGPCVKETCGMLGCTGTSWRTNRVFKNMSYEEEDACWTYDVGPTESSKICNCRTKHAKHCFLLYVYILCKYCADLHPMYICIRCITIILMYTYLCIRIYVYVFVMVHVLTCVSVCISYANPYVNLCALVSLY